MGEKLAFIIKDMNIINFFTVITRSGIKHSTILESFHSNEFSNLFFAIIPRKYFKILKIYSINIEYLLIIAP